MTPDCCKDCENLCAEGGCRVDGKNCYKWRAWFRTEWERIRKAAEIIKKNNKEEPST